MGASRGTLGRFGGFADLVCSLGYPRRTPRAFLAGQTPNCIINITAMSFLAAPMKRTDSGRFVVSRELRSSRGNLSDQRSWVRIKSGHFQIEPFSSSMDATILYIIFCLTFYMLYFVFSIAILPRSSVVGLTSFVETLERL